MPEQNSMHIHLNWAKERIDEMDAALTSLETTARQAQAESQVNANQLIAEMKKRRDEFKATVKKQADQGQAVLHASKTHLESQWDGFEAQVKTYFDTVGKQIEQQPAIFRDLAAAQMKAWHEAADKFHQEAAKVGAASRAEVDAAIKQMKADAAEAEARLQALKQTGSETWTALSSALTESRKAFDLANQKAGDALAASAKEATSAE